MKHKISVCAAVWDAPEVTREFVESLRKNTHLNIELVIVDNGSSEETAQYLRSVADVYYRFDENQGFCKGFNKAVSLCTNQHVLMTNNDTVWPQEDWQTTLLEDFSKFKNCGLLFPATNNILSRANLREKAAMHYLKLIRWHPFFCSGVAIFTKKTWFDSVNGFEESYVTGAEDSDLQCKFWEIGMDIYVTEHVFVKHIGKVSSRRLDDWKTLWKKNGEKLYEKWSQKFRKGLFWRVLNEANFYFSKKYFR